MPRQPRALRLAAPLALAIGFAGLAADARAQVVTCVNCGTEFTQLANNLQLADQLARQVELVQQSIRQSENLLLNTTGLEAFRFGNVAGNLRQVTSLLGQAKSLSFTSAGLDGQFAQKYKDYDAYVSQKLDAGALDRKYQQWSEDTSSSVLTTLKAANLQNSQMEGEEETLFKQLEEMSTTAEGRMQAIQVANQIGIAAAPPNPEAAPAHARPAPVAGQLHPDPDGQAIRAGSRLQEFHQGQGYQHRQWREILTVRQRFLFLLLGVLLVAAVDPALAQDNSLDRIVELYRGNAQRWEATLAGSALTLFWILATIEFTWAAIQLAFRGADFGEWLSTLVNQVLFIGFFAALLQFSAEWARAIVDSFRQAASAAAQANGASGGIAPSDIFDTGMQIATRFTESASLWSPFASVGLFIGMLVVIICFALIAAFMVLTLVKSYIVISAGVLFMGFGGSRWTKDFATRTLVYTVSVGAKLFILQLLVSLGAQIFRDLGAGVANDQAGLFTIIGAAIVMLAVTKSVPEMVQGLINGSSHGQSAAGWTAATAAVTGLCRRHIGDEKRRSPCSGATQG